MHLSVRTRGPEPVIARELKTGLPLKLTETSEGTRTVEASCEARVSMVTMRRTSLMEFLS